MLEDPIVIRKSKGNLIVSAVLDTDPIQLIRQINPTTLEIHLKNGKTYVDSTTPETIESDVLELMGFRHEELMITFHCWPANQDCRLDFKPLSTEATEQLIGEQILKSLFAPTPYISSKLISFEILNVREQVKDYYDDKYGSYDVTASVEFWCRVDMLKEVLARAYKVGLTDDITGFVQIKNKKQYTHISRCDAHYEFTKQD